MGSRRLSFVRLVLVDEYPDTSNDEPVVSTIIYPVRLHQGMRKQNPGGVNEAWRNPENLRAPAFHMIGDIYYVGNRDVSCHLISSDEGLVLIDTGFATTVPLLIDSIRSIGFDEKEVSWILITHGHEDHAGGTRRTKEATGADVFVHEGDVSTVEAGTELTCGYYIYGVEEFETFKVDRPLKGGEELRLGDALIKVHHTPGHTPGCCSYEIPVKHEGRKLRAFLFGGPGQWTFKRENRSQGYKGDMEDYGRTLEYLSNIKVEIPLGAHPGQNSTLGKYENARLDPEGANPFIDPGHWTTFLERLQKNFQSIRSQ